MRPRTRKPIVYVPSWLLESVFEGDLYGYYHAETDRFNIVTVENGADWQAGLSKVGRITNGQSSAEVADSPVFLSGLRGTNGLEFFCDGFVCDQISYDLDSDLFSRAGGIVESDRMRCKTAIISGCGSVGSLVAIELARAGVGRFLLVDNDVLQYHNLCRHQGGVADVGRYKVEVVASRIHQTNPKAIVQTESRMLEDLPKSVFDEFCGPQSILVGCADNREGDIYASKVCCIFVTPFLSIGLWERAFAGEVFYWLPQDMPCYVCPFGHRETQLSARTSENRRHYTNEEDLADVTFEPGISVDISFVTYVGLKLALDILNRDDPSYIPKVLSHLSQFTLVCNSVDQRFGGSRAEIFSYPLQVTTSIGVEFRSPCPPCQFV